MIGNPTIISLPSIDTRSVGWLAKRCVGSIHVTANLECPITSRGRIRSRRNCGRIVGLASCRSRQTCWSSTYRCGHAIDGRENGRDSSNGRAINYGNPSTLSIYSANPLVNLSRFSCWKRGTDYPVAQQEPQILCCKGGQQQQPSYW
jgi:hypothetical protein